MTIPRVCPLCREAFYPVRPQAHSIPQFCTLICADAAAVVVALQVHCAYCEKIKQPGMVGVLCAQQASDGWWCSDRCLVNYALRRRRIASV